MLYDLTSTYFECDPPAEGKRKYGYSRDKRPDCVQVVIALIVTPEGFPLTYEVLAGNTSDKSTLADFLAKIEAQCGKAGRIWVMDRGIPTEETLAKMRSSSPPVSYLVGTPKGRLTALEQDFFGKPWSQAKETVSVKLLALGAGGRGLHPCQERRPGAQGARYAAQETQEILGQAQRVTQAGAFPRSAASLGQLDGQQAGSASGSRRSLPSCAARFNNCREVRLHSGLKSQFSSEFIRPGAYPTLPPAGSKGHTPSRK